MPRLYRAVALLAILALAGFSLAVQADTPRGVFGIGLNVDGEGFFLNPTLKSITITEVRKGMPAEAAGIAVGDQIVEVEGKTVAGAKAKDLQPYLRRAPGDVTHMRLKRANGEAYSVTMTAVAAKD
jgi:C-terminal processing protease CtpA/Prc